MTYSAEVLADSPLVYWRLGETSGTTAADTSGNSHTGTYTNSPTLGVAGALTGDSNTAVTFNGTSQYVIAAAGSWQNVSDYTVEFWFKSTTTSVTAFMASRDTGTAPNKTWDIAFNNLTGDGKLVFGTWFSAPASTFQPLYTVNSFNDGAWHHCACVKSGTTMLIYVNGALENSTTYSSFDTSTTSTINIGRRGNNSDFFPGSLDEFAFYGSVLSATRIAAHYAAGAASAFTGSAASPVTASTSGAGVVGAVTTAALTAVATITAAGVVATSTDATQPVTATITADGVVGTATDATLATTADLTADGTVDTATDANLTAAASIAADGLVVSGKQGAAAQTVTVTIGADGTIAASIDAALPVAAAITADGQTQTATDASLTATAAITAAGTVHRTLQTPPERTYDVAPRSRTVTVTARDRTVTVTARDRTYIVPSRPRS